MTEIKASTDCPQTRLLINSAFTLGCQIAGRFGLAPMGSGGLRRGVTAGHDWQYLERSSQHMAVRVLIVEDDPAQRRILEELVRRFGCDPVPVDGGMRGLEVLKSHSGGTIELIILDLNMPGMDGLEFLRAIRADATTKAMAFILLTGRADKDLVQRAAQFGANNYMVKPFTVATLKQKLDQIFGELV